MDFTRLKLNWRIAVISTGLILHGASCGVNQSHGENYEAASTAYSALAEKSLDLLAGFNLDSWASMLSDSVVYYFPEGDVKTCRKLTGKKEVLDWWKNYVSSSGLESMSIENATYMPIHLRNGIRPSDLPGTQVIAYFSNKLVYDRGAVSVKMNFVIHFDKAKMIDGYYTYYDRATINQVFNRPATGGDSLMSVTPVRPDSQFSL